MTFIVMTLMFYISSFIACVELLKGILSIEEDLPFRYQSNVTPDDVKDFCLIPLFNTIVAIYLFGIFLGLLFKLEQRFDKYIGKNK